MSEHFTQRHTDDPDRTDHTNRTDQADQAETVAVVGAGTGMGLAVARRFGRAGATVGLLARSAGRLDRLVGELASEGMDAAGFPADVADPESLRAALRAMRTQLGDPTVLVYNPSAYIPGTATGTPYDAFVEGLRVGVAGLLVAAQEVTPAMREAGRGTVLVTGSGSAFQGSTESAALAVQKAGVRSLALSLAKELAPDGIHVVTVTIRGTLSAGSHFDPNMIAEHYWLLHRQTRTEWDTEFIYK